MFCRRRFSYEAPLFRLISFSPDTLPPIRFADDAAATFFPAFFAAAAFYHRNAAVTDAADFAALIMPIFADVSRHAMPFSRQIAAAP